MLTGFVKQYPAIMVEVIVNDRFADIVEAGFDGGIRLGRDVAPGMLSFPVGAPSRSIVVASPDYIGERGRPMVPADLQHHDCIDYRMETSGRRYAWQFERDGKK